jgi:hypothetical protein
MRIVVGLTENASPAEVAERLRAAGAQDVRPPRAELPRVLVAEFPDAVDGVARASAVRGVAYAEPDAPRFTDL